MTPHITAAQAEAREKFLTDNHTSFDAEKLNTIVADTFKKGVAAERGRWLNQPANEHDNTIRQQLLDAVLSEIGQLVAEEERAQQWISKGGVDYIDNKARLDILGKTKTAIKNLLDVNK